MTTNTGNKQYSGINIIIGILVFGSIWGLLEATLGGFFNMILFPNKGAIMAAIGVTIMGTALAIYRKPAMSLAIGIIAASFKLLNIWIFTPVSYIHIINPATAIVAESLAFTIVAVVLVNRMERSALVPIGAGFLAGLITATAYVYFALYVTHAPILQRMGVSGAGEFIATQGLIQAAFFGIFLPIGYQLGKKLAVTNPLATLGRPLYYSISAAAVCLCWGVSAIAIAAGL